MTDDITDRLARVITKTKSVEAAKVTAVTLAIIEGCRKTGIAIVDEDMVFDEPDAHLTMLKGLRATIKSHVDGEISGRDLASLSRRLQDISEKIFSIEEKMTADKRREGGSGGRNNGTAKAKAGSFNPAEA